MNEKFHPAKRNDLWVHVQKIKVGPPTTYRVLNESCSVVLTHFIETMGRMGRDAPHLIDPIFCVGCQVGQRPRLKPFLSCWCDAAARHVLLQLTEECLRLEPDLIPANKVNLRGRRITVWRDGNRPNAPGRVALHVKDPEGDKWPIGVDEDAVLARLWGVVPEAITHVYDLA